MNRSEQFDVDRGWWWSWVFFSTVFAGFAVACLAPAFLDDDGTTLNDSLEYLIVVGCVSAVAAFLSWCVVRLSPSMAISLDGDGVWRAIDDRDATLVRWSDVVRLRERPFLQRLDLLGRSGELLLKLSYCLGDFPRLRGIVLERAFLEPVRWASGRTIGRGYAYHLGTLVALVGLTAFGVHLWSRDPFLSGVWLTVVVGAGSWFYLTTPYKVDLLPSGLILSSPLEKLELMRSDIVSVEVSDLVIRLRRETEVVLTHAKSREPVVLRLGVSAIELKRAIESWQNDAA